MHNKVVYHAMKALNDPAWGLEMPVLRFNFRGTGLSEGEHDDLAESGDVLAAIEWLESEYNRPVVVAGFSFGAAMALKACCGRDDAQVSHPFDRNKSNGWGTHLRAPASETSNVRAVIALGLPTETSGHNYRYSFLSKCSLPKLFISGDRDLFAPAEQLRQVAADASEPKRLVLLPDADHFFTGHLEAMQRELAGWIKEQLQ